MAGQKKGLGRGLDALLDPYRTEEAESEKDRVIRVPIRQIDTNLEQPRKDFNEAALRELADSIRVHGVVQPLIVVRKGERYTIVAGERRFRAARMAGLTELPVLVADYDDRQIHEVALIENIQRQDLNPIEEAAAIRFLMEQHDLTQEEVSGRIGRSRPAVANTLRLLQLPEETIELVRRGELTAGHGRALAGVRDKKLLRSLTAETLRMGYSVRALESRIRNLQEKKEGPKRKKGAQKNAVLAEAERMLREALGTRVRIEGTGEKGTVTLYYYSGSELNGLFDRLTRES